MCVIGQLGMYGYTVYGASKVMFKPLCYDWSMLSSINENGNYRFTAVLCTLILMLFLNNNMIYVINTYPKFGIRGFAEALEMEVKVL